VRDYKSLRLAIMTCVWTVVNAHSHRQTAFDWNILLAQPQLTGWTERYHSDNFCINWQLLLTPADVWLSYSGTAMTVNTLTAFVRQMLFARWRQDPGASVTVMLEWLSLPLNCRTDPSVNTFKNRFKCVATLTHKIDWLILMC